MDYHDDDDFRIVSDADIKQQKNKLKGKNKHNSEDTNKYHVMNLNKYDIIIEEDVKLSNSAYNGIKEFQRKFKRIEHNRGKRK